MKKGLFILLLFLLSTVQHDFVTLSFKNCGINSFDQKTIALLVTDDFDLNFNQNINTSNAITNSPIFNESLSEQTSLIEGFFVKVPIFVENLFLKIKSLSAVILEVTSSSYFNGSESKEAEYILNCNFRL
ncbi:MAG: hypothetical protein WCP69_11605 [Bacteroidota bacterium]